MFCFFVNNMLSFVCKANGLCCVIVRQTACVRRVRVWIINSCWRGRGAVAAGQQPIVSCRFRLHGSQLNMQRIGSPATKVRVGVTSITCHIFMLLVHQLAVILRVLFSLRFLRWDPDLGPFYMSYFRYNIVCRLVSEFGRVCERRKLRVNVRVKLRGDRSM